MENEIGRSWKCVGITYSDKLSFLDWKMELSFGKCDMWNPNFRRENEALEEEEERERETLRDY